MEHFLKDELPLFDKASAAGPSDRRQKEEHCIDIPEQSHVPKKTAEENQNQDMGKHISRVPEALFQTNPSAYRIREPGSENSIKNDFQKAFFGNTEGLKERCRKKLTSLMGEARSCYTDNANHISNDEFVDMLLLHGCFTLEFFYKMESGKDDGFMKVNGKVAQTLSDMLLFENQLPFFVLFELHKLKRNNDDDVALLKELIELVKKCYMNQVSKLTTLNVFPSKYKPENLPKHLLDVVYSLCIPTNIAKSDEDCGRVLQQIKPATELEKNGVRFKKIDKVHTTLFDIDFNWGIMKIPCFSIDDFTETFLRNIIAYEQHSGGASRYFTDFVLLMGQLINKPEDVELLSGSGIIVHLQATSEEVKKMFSKLRVGIDTSTTSTLSRVIDKVNRHGEKPWNVWIGKLRKNLYQSPWKLIFAALGGLSIPLSVAVSIKILVK